MDKIIYLPYLADTLEAPRENALAHGDDPPAEALLMGAARWV